MKNISVRKKQTKSCEVISYFDGKKKVAEIWAWHEGKFLLGHFAASMYINRPKDTIRAEETQAAAVKWIEKELQKMFGQCHFQEHPQRQQTSLQLL